MSVSIQTSLSVRYSFCTLLLASSCISLCAVCYRSPQGRTETDVKLQNGGVTRVLVRWRKEKCIRARVDETNRTQRFPWKSDCKTTQYLNSQIILTCRALHSPLIPSLRNVWVTFSPVAHSDSPGGRFSFTLYSLRKVSRGRCRGWDFACSSYTMHDEIRLLICANFQHGGPAR